MQKKTPTNVKKINFFKFKTPLDINQNKLRKKAKQTHELGGYKIKEKNEIIK